MKPLFLYILFFSFAGFAQQQPTKVTYAKSVDSFVTKGWKIITTAKGDLNKDGTEDVALVIEDTDKANIITNTEANALPENFNTNPRHLLLLFKDKLANTYYLQAKNESFIPPKDNPNMPCLVDPLLDSGELAIKNGTLQITLQNFTSCGNWADDTYTYTLRYQQGEFKLIGFDSNGSNRATGEVFNISINYLTKKKSSTNGENRFEDDKSKHKIVWETIKVNKLLTLTDLNRT